MSTSSVETEDRLVWAIGLTMGDTDFTVCLQDGRRITVPYYCYPHLARASRMQRSHFEVYAEGKMLHWPDIDEDIEVQHIVEGRMPVKKGSSAMAVAEKRTACVASPKRRRRGNSDNSCEFKGNRVVCKRVARAGMGD